MRLLCLLWLCTGLAMGLYAQDKQAQDALKAQIAAEKQAQKAYENEGKNLTKAFKNVLKTQAHWKWDGKIYTDIYAENPYAILVARGTSGRARLQLLLRLKRNRIEMTPQLCFDNNYPLLDRGLETGGRLLDLKVQYDTGGRWQAEVLRILQESIYDFHSDLMLYPIKRKAKPQDPIQAFREAWQVSISYQSSVFSSDKGVIITQVFQVGGMDALASAILPLMRWKLRTP